MKRYFIIALVLFNSTILTGQTAVGQWSDHLPYNTASCIAAGSDEIFASTGPALLIYNKKYDELKKMSRVNGLTGTGISSIGWSDDLKTLVIAYSNTNIDLLVSNLIYNLPDIFRKYIDGKKTINRVRINGKFAFLACSFGIVIIDLEKKEIYDTWKPASNSDINGVNDITFSSDKIYAATDNGVFAAGLTDQGLSYFGNWNLVDILPVTNGRYTAVISAGNRIFCNLSDPANGDRIYATGNPATMISFMQGIINSSIDNSVSGFIVSSGSLLRYFDTNGKQTASVTSYGWGPPQAVMAVEDNSGTWIADSRSGLVRSDDRVTFTALTLPGPVSARSFYITSLNGKTVICGGGTDASWSNAGLPLEISVSENNDWNDITSSSILDPVRAVIDPADNTHMFVSTWGGGLLEYRNNSLIMQYNSSNSPLQSAVPGRPYSRICGMAYDKSGNLWITQSGVQGSIKILKADGNWVTIPVTIDAPVAGDLIITAKGQKWIILPGSHGLFVFDDNKTIDNFSDDKFKQIQVTDADNQQVTAVYSIAEDLDGNLWVGTDQGPLIYFNTDNVFTTDIRASRIKVPRNDGTNLADYMLKSESITAISVDGANRKWLGTSGSGAYLLTPDGLKIEKNFNTGNSPLLSNSISSLTTDNKTGEVWFATGSGVESFRGNATEGNEKFAKVYAFPNPVRENFTGNLTITGLMRNTQLRITDISGNLVYSTVSEGGEATWDLKTYTGKRVSTGVYLIFCASEDGTQSCVSKVLIMK